MVALAARPLDMATVIPISATEAKLRLTLHPGQMRAWKSDKRFVLILAGLQSGKTVMGPPFLWREMQTKGPGDYLVGSPTFTLLELKALPEFKRFFIDRMQAGKYKGSPVREFTLSEAGEIKLWGAKQDTPTRVLFGHAQDPESLESGTYKAAWLDEAGQKKFRRDSWVSVQGRLSIYQGRVLFTTTVYVLGWLKSELYDPWVAANGDHPEIDVINFESIENPAFPRAEFERMRRILPAWLFNMRYRGRFERPAGMIYDCWSDTENVLTAFAIPEHWPRFLGADFGGVNTAAIKVAQELDGDGKPTGRYIAYGEYLAGGRTAAQHKDEWMRGEPRLPTAIGGSASEGQWRLEFGNAEFPIWAPLISDVEVGILRLYGAIKERKFLALNTLAGFLDQVHSYSRELDANGEPTEKIEDKEQYHYLDAARYFATFINWDNPEAEAFSWL